MQWPAEPEPPPLPSPPPVRERRPRTVDPLAGLAEELSRTPSASEASDIEQALRPLPRREPRPPRPQSAAPQPPIAAAPPASDPPFNSAADQNLAEMAHRLEAALRRPGKDDNRPAPPPHATGEPEADVGEEFAAPPGVPPPARAPAPNDAARPARSEARPPRSESRPVAQQKSLYDSLEQEMASLLGRPNGKT